MSRGQSTTELGREWLRDAVLFECAGLVVEPSAALGVAAILGNPERFARLSVATVVCGSNVTRSDFRAWAMDSHGDVPDPKQRSAFSRTSGG